MNAAPPPDFGKLIASLFMIVSFIFGAALPLLLSAMVPNGYQRWGGAIFCLLGVAVLIGIAGSNSPPLNLGLGLGLCLASLKLATGLRFL